VFAALTKALKAPNGAHEPCTALNEARNENYEKRVDEFFDSDFLSPLLAALLFPDFMQHFLPFPIPPFDRARALEASIEKTWAQIAPETLIFSAATSLRYGSRTGRRRLWY
jgi:hypothetical protein